MKRIKIQPCLRVFFVLSVFVLASNCASNGVERKPAKQRNFISQEEIEGLATARTARDAVEIARPIWLRGKGIDPSVYMNGILMGGLEHLDNISIHAVKEMRFLSSTEATTLYGTNNMGGVIEIKSR
ncbi:MAG: hypothetical protein H8E56_01050 [Candidatus Marinimicrobia bacterium]|nr:hypothetical protein [Candidatus Neomarinimicrobiota bacterium]